MLKTLKYISIYTTKALCLLNTANTFIVHGLFKNNASITEMCSK